MRRVRNDPLSKQHGTLRLEYHAITEKGLSIECTTRTFRATDEQRRELEAFVQKLSAQTPELQEMWHKELGGK